MAIDNSPDLEPYLRATPVIDAGDEAVRARALEIAGPHETELERARALFEWVRDSIPHSWDIQASVVTCSASEVLREGTGICMAKSHLLAALCRAVDIPAGLCYQVFRGEGFDAEFGLHGFNAIYLRSLSRWIRVDPRGNKPGVDARFNLEEEQLAFPPEPDRGEFIYDTIFADPDPGVVAYLEGYDNLQEAWPHLPSDITSTSA